MKVRRFWLVLVLVACAIGWAGSSFLVNAAAEGKADQGASAMDAAMAAWMKVATPGDHHKHLQQMTGTWKAAGTFWMMPDAPPMTSAGTMKGEMILDGRFLKSDYTGDMMGSVFRGMSIDGYDNQTHKHTGMWMDTMGTMIMTFEGTCENNGKVRTMHSEFTDPMTGQKVKMKTVTTMQSPDKFTYETWETKPGAEPRKAMEIVFTRQG